MAILGFFLIAAVLLVPGTLIMVYSKSGMQETLGGVLVMLGVVFALIAASLWSLGL